MISLIIGYLLSHVYYLRLLGVSILHLWLKKRTYCIILIFVSALTPFLAVAGDRFLPVARLIKDASPFSTVSVPNLRRILTFDLLILKHKSGRCLQITAECRWLFSVKSRWRRLHSDILLWFFPMLVLGVPMIKQLPLTLVVVILWAQVLFLIIALSSLGQLSVRLLVIR